jgi:hypothetical protein
MAASGFVPATELDGGSSNLRLDGGDREGSDYFFLSFREVLSINTSDLCIVFFSYGVLCKKMYLHRLE